MNRLTPAFGQWLKQRRKALDLTQEELALRVDCSVSTVEKIESGERRPSRQVAGLLAGFFGVPASERQAFVRFARSEAPAGEESPVWTVEAEGIGVGVSVGVGAVAEAQPGTGGGPWRAAHRRRTNLPVPLTSLVGREREMAALHDLIHRERTRLVTLAGPPGTGKTRLAIEVASHAAGTGEFEDGVFFVPLAGVGDPGLVMAAVARALKLPEAPGHSLVESVKEHLAGQRALLVLDNFEHVLPAAVEVADLLIHSPWLKVLATSREPLRVRGERRFPVPPLEVPEATTAKDATLDPSSLVECGSVALFVERARDAAPTFELTPANVAAVAEIVRRLEGLPLAIELVASSTSLGSLEALLGRLERGIEVESELQDVPARHRTLRDATRWSYDLLEPGEQRLFARLALFEGGWTRSAAEAVCNARGDLPLRVGRGLDSLRHKSLLEEQQAVGDDAGGDGEPRYTMLQTIREYALERLSESGEEGILRRLHAEYYLALVEAAEAELDGPLQAALIGRLEQEHDNLRAALQYALDEGHAGQALLMTGALAPFWSARGHLSEGREWLEKALAKDAAATRRAAPTTPTTPTASHRANALLGAGLLASRQGDYVHAVAYYEEGLAIYRAASDRRGVALALGRLGAVANERGDFDRADEYYRESLSLWREVGDRAGIAGLLNNMGNQETLRGNPEEAARFYLESLEIAREVGSRQRATTALLNLGRLALHHRCDYGEAVRYLEESLRLCREVGNRGGVAASLYQLGSAYLYAGSYEKARAALEESLSLCEELDEKPGVASTRMGLALVALQQGGFRQAGALLVASMALFREHGLRVGVLECVEALGGLAAMTGDPRHATVLLGAAVAWREGAGLSASLAHGALLSSWAEAARTRLGPEEYERASREGRAMSPGEAIERAVRANSIASWSVPPRTGKVATLP